MRDFAGDSGADDARNRCDAGHAEYKNIRLAFERYAFSSSETTDEKKVRGTERPS